MAVPTEPPCPPLAARASTAPPEPPIERADIVPTADYVGEVLKALAAAAPCDARVSELARTHQGRSVHAITLGRAPAHAPSVLLVAGTHGDEPLAITIALDAVRQLATRGGTDPAVARLLSELRVVVVPLLNPDGYELWRGLSASQRAKQKKQSPGRKNGRDLDGNAKHAGWEGVDLNRNYPFRWAAGKEVGSSSSKSQRSYRGPSPGSEPETQGVMALAERERFAAALSLHTGQATILAPYSAVGVEQPEPNEAWTIALDAARAMPKHPDVWSKGPIPVMARLYPVDGTDQDWLRHSFGTLAFTVESSVRSDDANHEAKAALAMRPLLPWIARRLLDGPSVVGRVLGPGGEPVTATVHLEPQVLKAGERWTTRPSDGSFARYLSAPGKVTVRVTTPDGRSASQVVDVRGREEVRITLPAVASPSPTP